MAQYLFINQETGEVKEVTQKMNEEHVYFEDGIEWHRLYTIPNAAVSSNVDPFSEKQFLEKSSGAKTMGELWERSAEISEKRAEKAGGEDPVKKKYFQEYSKIRKGRKHLEQLKQETT